MSRGGEGDSFGVSEKVLSYSRGTTTEQQVMTEQGNDDRVRDADSRVTMKDRVC